MQWRQWWPANAMLRGTTTSLLRTGYATHPSPCWSVAQRCTRLRSFGISRTNDDGSGGKQRRLNKVPSLPQLNEEDVEETFVRGSGPGGQAINKTNISVSLLHKPTGIRVQCHQTRSRESNRSLARKILRERVDLALNPGQSKLEAKWSKEAAKKAARERKRRRKLRESAQANDDDEPENPGGPSLTLGVRKSGAPLSDPL